MARKDYTPEQAIGMHRGGRGAVEPGREVRKDLPDPGDLGVELLSVATAVRRAEGKSGTPDEGARERTST